MIRYLKYIFLVFGGLALAIMGFFSLQNKKDLKLVYHYWGKLDYETIQASCETPNQYYYPCFKEVFGEYLEQAGLTGVGFGLKLAFNFMDKDKRSSKMAEEKVKEMVYALNYLELNNMAIRSSYQRFYGFKKMYGGYLSSLRDFLEGAKKFSDNLVKGIESEEGLEAIEDPAQRERMKKRFSKLKENYIEEIEKATTFVSSEVEELLAAQAQE